MLKDGADLGGRPEQVALSDLHLDFRDNRAKFDALSATDYADDTLLLGGDLTHDLGLLESALGSAREKFLLARCNPHGRWVEWLS